jgi:glycosyltransferase involved in cell wall biosynthesis
VRGWGSLIGTILIIGGIQLMFIGMTGEYLARVFEESKRRPLYFFKQQPEDVASAARVSSSR